MSNPIKNTVLRALLNSVITDLMFKTTGEQVFLDKDTTVSAKIAEIVAAINDRAKIDYVNEIAAGLSDTKANQTALDELVEIVNDLIQKHADDITAIDTRFEEVIGDTNTSVDSKLTALEEAIMGDHQSDISTIAGRIDDLNDAVDERPTLVTVTDMVNALRQEMLGDVPVEAYNTFTELAEYIASHDDISEALTAAIGTKAEQTDLDALVEIVEAHTTQIEGKAEQSDLDAATERLTSVEETIDTLGSLATKEEVSEDELSDDLKEKVNAASEGNHSHLNKEILDDIDENDISACDAAAGGGIVQTSDYILSGSYAGGLRINEIGGKSEQDGDPTPDAPIDIDSVEISEIWAHGKNLLDCRGLTEDVSSLGITWTPVYDVDGILEYININGTTTTGYAKAVNIQANAVSLKKGETIILSGCPKNDSGTTYPRLQLREIVDGSVGNYITNAFDTGDGVEYTATEDITVLVYLRIEADTVCDNLKIYPMIRYADIEDDIYEPYQSKSITLSQSTTLYGVGDVTDLMTTRGIERKFGKKTFAGTWALLGTTDSGYYVFSSSDFITDMRYATDSYAKCSHLLYGGAVGSNVGALLLNDDNCFYRYYNATITEGTYPITYICTSTCTTVEELEVMFADTEFIYELTTPTYEELPVSDQIALNSLRTYDGATYIYSDSEIDPVWDIEYGTDKVSAVTIGLENTVLQTGVKANQDDVNTKIAALEESIKIEHQNDISTINAIVSSHTEQLAKVLIIESFDSATGTLVTRSADYTG